MKTRYVHRQLSLPTGTETLRLLEAARYKRIRRHLEDLFEAWGYHPVETPVLDYFEVYRRLLNESDIRQMYRAVDRQGEILALRSDTTIFLAKQLGLHLTPEELPVRVYYHDQIVRAEEQHDIASNEYEQAGIELVGIPGVAGDAEAIVLAMEALSTLGAPDPIVHIGSHAVLQAILRAARSDPRRDETEDNRGASSAIFQSVQRRSFGDPAITVLPQPFQQVLPFIGGIDQFESLITDLSGEIPKEVVTASQELVETIRTVCDVVPERHRSQIRIDLSELGSHGYYTGIAFSAYLPNSNSAVLRGGRYDRLLVSFGMDAPSVGFSMFPRKLPGGTLEGTGSVSTTEEGNTLLDRINAGREAVGQKGKGRS